MGVLGALADVIAVVCVSFCGGLLNRLRGSGAPNMAEVSTMGYWETAAYSRAVEAVPLVAVIRLLSRDLPSSVLLLVAVWSSLLIGWGTYFGMGEPNGYTSRIGEFDWLFGREMPGWGFDRRWVRSYPAMMLRGLQWTMPGGYLLAHRGGGWAFCLSGALMPVAYTIASHTGLPNVEDGFMFSGGTAWAESVWGMWLWFVVLASLLARPHSTTRTVRFEKPFKGAFGSVVFESIVLMTQAINIGSCIYYSHIDQCDDRNWQQTYVGLLFVTGAQFVSHAAVLVARNCCPTQASVNLEEIDADDVEDTAPKSPAR